MKLTSRISLLVIACLALCMVSCQEKENDISHLYQKWDLSMASRDGKPTSSLRNAYFDFSDKATLESNILGQVDRSPYAVEGNLIHQTEPIEVKYTIEKLTADTLILRSAMMSTQFEFICVKSLDE